jgi:hypothetical protein
MRGVARIAPWASTSRPRPGPPAVTAERTLLDVLPSAGALAKTPRPGTGRRPRLRGWL